MNFKYDGFTLSELTDLTDVVLMREGSSPDHHLYFEIQALEKAGRYLKKKFPNGLGAPTSKKSVNPWYLKVSQIHSMGSVLAYFQRLILMDFW